MIALPHEVPPSAAINATHAITNAADGLRRGRPSAPDAQPVHRVI
jgi:hypothetical protein